MRDLMRAARRSDVPGLVTDFQRQDAFPPDI
jgi:hypothetical protein